MNNIWHLLNNIYSKNRFPVSLGFYTAYQSWSYQIPLVLYHSFHQAVHTSTLCLTLPLALPQTKHLLSLPFQHPIKQICCQSEDTWNELSSRFFDLFNTSGSKITISSWREKCQRSKSSTPTTVLVFLC